MFFGAVYISSPLRRRQFVLRFLDGDGQILKRLTYFYSRYDTQVLFSSQKFLDSV